MFILNSIVPIFLLILFGKLLQKSNFFPENFFKALNKLVFWFALPALLISNISSAKLEFSAISRIVLLFTAGTLLTLLAAWIVARLLKLPRPSSGSFIQGAFRGNGAFVGLPVIIYSVGSLYPETAVLATVVLAPVVIIFNILGVLVLQHYGNKKESSGHALLALVKNPLIVSCLIGIALNLASLELPVMLARPLEALGRAALPLILMSIGASLVIEKVQGVASPSLIASLIKVCIPPSLGFLLATCFSMETSEKMIAVLYLGCPAAGMSYVMADVMGNDAPLAGRIVALSTLLSAITLPILIAIGL